MTGLAAGVFSPGTTAVTIPAATPIGEYFLLVCADDTFLVTETDETNRLPRLRGELRVTP